MKTKLWAIILVSVSTIFTAIAQLMLKIGTKNLSLNFYRLITNYYLLAGILIYAVCAVALIISLKNGELSILYPLVALGFVWVSVFSVIFLKEAMNAYRWLGIFVIVAGVSLIGYGGNAKKKKRKKTKNRKERKR